MSHPRLVGAQVDSATIQFTGAENATAEVAAEISLLPADASIPRAGQRLDVQSQSRFVAWAVPAWGSTNLRSFEHSTSDLASLILTERWKAGQHVDVAIRTSGTADSHLVQLSQSATPSLSISYRSKYCSLVAAVLC